MTFDGRGRRHGRNAPQVASGITWRQPRPFWRYSSESVFEIYVVANWRGPGRVAGFPRARRRVMVVMAAQRMMASDVAGWRS